MLSTRLLAAMPFLCLLINADDSGSSSDSDSSGDSGPLLYSDISDNSYSNESEFSAYSHYSGDSTCNEEVENYCCSTSHIDLSRQGLTLIPSVGHDGLTSLDLSDNNIKTMSGYYSLGGFDTLQELNLGSNPLDSIPGCIKAFKSLRKLDVSCNDLTIVSPEMGSMESLEELDFGGNHSLKSLPGTFVHLRKLRKLDIEYADSFLKIGRTDRLGWRELQCIFGKDVVHVPERRSDDLDLKEISESDVYKTLSSHRISWDIGTLRAMRLVPIPRRRGENAPELWKSSIKEQRPYMLSKTLQERMGTHLGAIYGEKGALDGTALAPHQEDIKDAIEAIFPRLADVLKHGEDSEASQYVGGVISEVSAQLDVWTDASRTVLLRIYNRPEPTDPLDLYFRKKIAEIKERTFELLITMIKREGNEEGFAELRSRLMSEVGVDVVYEPLCKPAEDISRGLFGNALHVFYLKFTPKSVVRRLIREINRRRAAELLDLLGEMPKDWLKRKRRRHAGVETVTEYCDEGVKDGLVKLGILQARAAQ